MWLAVAVTAAALGTAPDDSPKADAWGPVVQLGTADGMVYAVSADGKQVVTRPMAKAVTVLDLPTGKVRRVAGEFGGHLGAVSYSPDGKLVACAEWNNGASIRDAKTWAVIDRITPSGRNPVSQAAFTPDGKRIAFYCWTWQGGYVPPEPAKPITHYDLQLVLWDVEKKQELGWPAKKQTGPALVHFHQGMFLHRPYLFTREDVSTDNGLPKSKTFTMTDIATNKTTPPIALDKDDIGLFDATPDGSQILVMTDGTDPRLVDVRTGKSGRSFGGHARLVTTAALSADGKLVVTASGRYGPGYAAAKQGDVGPTELRIHEVATGRLIASYQSDSLTDFAYVGFSPDGKFVYAQGKDYQLMLWGKFPPPPAGVTVNWPVDPKPAPFGGVSPLAPPTRPGSPFDLPVADSLDKLVEALPRSGRPVEQQIDALYLAALGRFPTQAEHKRVADLVGPKPTAEKWKKVLDALVKTPEFEAHVQSLRKRAKPEPATPVWPAFPANPYWPHYQSGPFPLLGVPDPPKKP